MQFILRNQIIRKNIQKQAGHISRPWEEQNARWRDEIDHNIRYKIKFNILQLIYRSTE